MNHAARQPVNGPIAPADIDEKTLLIQVRVNQEARELAGELKGKKLTEEEEAQAISRAEKIFQEAQAAGVSVSGFQNARDLVEQSRKPQKEEVKTQPSLREFDEDKKKKKKDGEQDPEKPSFFSNPVAWAKSKLAALVATNAEERLEESGKNSAPRPPSREEIMAARKLQIAKTQELARLITEDQDQLPQLAAERVRDLGNHPAPSMSQPKPAGPKKDEIILG